VGACSGAPVTGCRVLCGFLALVLGFFVAAASGDRTEDRSRDSDTAVRRDGPMGAGEEFEWYEDYLASGKEALAAKPHTGLQEDGDLYELARDFYVHVLLPHFKGRMKDMPPERERYATWAAMASAQTLVMQEFSDSDFGDYLKSFLIADSLRGDIVGSQEFGAWGVDLYLAMSSEDRLEHIPSEVGEADDSVFTFWEAVQEFTFQYDVADEGEFQEWWKQHKRDTRSEWARQKVNTLLAREGPLSKQDRHILFKVTKSIAIAYPEGEAEFRTWWEANREKSRSAWVKQMVEEAIANLAVEDEQARESARSQLGAIFGTCFASLEILGAQLIWDLSDGFAEDDESLKRIQARYWQWWAENGESYWPGWTTGAAEGTWFYLNGLHDESD